MCLLSVIVRTCISCCTCISIVHVFLYFCCTCIMHACQLSAGHHYIIVLLNLQRQQQKHALSVCGFPNEQTNITCAVNSSPVQRGYKQLKVILYSVFPLLVQFSCHIILFVTVNAGYVPADYASIAIIMTHTHKSRSSASEFTLLLILEISAIKRIGFQSVLCCILPV